MALMNCPECNKEVSSQATSCPYCGYPLQQAHETQAPIEQYQAPQNVGYSKPPTKKKGKGCLMIVLIPLAFVALIVFCVVNYGIPDDGLASSDITDNTTEESLLAFDERSWKDFENIYKAHNNLMVAMDLYTNGKMAAVDFYNNCDSVESYMAQASTKLNYGTTDDEKDYLSSFQTMALADQNAAKLLKKYVDSPSVADLSSIQKEIQTAKDAAVMIASNRGILLVKAGLTDEEIKEKVEADMKALEDQLSK